MFPRESEFVEHLNRQLSDVFATCNSALALGVSVVTERQSTIDRSAIETQPLRNAMGHAICVKACKLLRGGVGLAIIGDGDTLDSVARTMFETFVASCFVLREDFHVKKKYGKLDAEFRAKLYFAHRVIKQHDRLEKLRKTPGCEDTVADIERLDGIGTIAVDYSRVTAGIGDEWVKVFREPPHNYSGLQIRQLVERLEDPMFLRWYDFVWRGQCSTVHAADPINHLREGKNGEGIEAKWFPSVDSIKLSLTMSGALMLGCIQELDNVYRFEGDVEKELAQLGVLINNATNMAVKEFE